MDSQHRAATVRTSSTSSGVQCRGDFWCTAIAAVNERIWRELNRSGRVPAHENLEGKEPDQLSVGVAVTLVALCDGGTQLLAAQHGDTHGYLSNAQGLLQLTQDQDLLRWEAMSGMLTEEQALGIGRALDHFDGVHLQEGMEEEMLRYFFDKSIFGALGIGAECPESDWSAVRLRLNDRVALLSDGAHSNMSISELATRLAWPDDPADAVIDLAQQRSVLPRFPDPNAPERAYNLRATQDDMTVLVVEVGPDSAP